MQIVVYCASISDDLTGCLQSCHSEIPVHSLQILIYCIAPLTSNFLTKLQLYLFYIHTFLVMSKFDCYKIYSTVYILKNHLIFIYK